MLKTMTFFSVVFTLFSLPTAADTHRFAVIVGNNLGHDPTARLRYAENDASKLHNVLMELGDFAEDNLELLLGEDVSRVRRAFKQMEYRSRLIRQKGGSRTLFVFYFSGHADGGKLELGQSSLEFDELKQMLASFDSDIRIAFLDSCESGRLIATKGGKRGSEYEIEVQNEVSSKGYAIITSSAHDEMSQESAEIRGAYFTHYLVSALRGAADESVDGKVTVVEAYQHAYSRTLARTSTTLAGSQHPMYHFQLEGRGDIVLTRTDRANARIAVETNQIGRLVLVNSVGQKMVAETALIPGRTALLAVTPGHYRAYLIAGESTVYMATVEAKATGKALLVQRDFSEVRLSEGVAKGGLFSDTRAPWTHMVGAGGLWRLFALEGGTASYGLSAHYRALYQTGIEPSMRFTWSTRRDTGKSTGYHDFGIQLGAAYLFELRWLNIRTGVFLGYEYLRQKKTDERRDTSGLSYLGFAGLELPIKRLYVTLDGGVGGRMFKVYTKGLVHRLDFQAGLSIGWRII